MPVLLSISPIAERPSPLSLSTCGRGSRCPEVVMAAIQKTKLE